MDNLNSKCKYKIIMGPYNNPTSLLVTELTEMQRQYRNSEDEFLQFNEIIPFNKNPTNIYSPKLVNISLYLGPQILGMFEILKQQINLTCADKFPSYYDTLNSSLLLSSQGFIMSGSRTVYHPFDSNNPAWWQAYNGIKHSMPSGIFQATLENVINMLGSLFILHHIADVIQRGIPSQHSADVLDPSNWLAVHTVGLYYYHKTSTAKGHTLYEGFLSDLISMEKRFLPYYKNSGIQPDYQY